MPSYHAADGAELFYEERGPGGTIPLLFVHGWQADGRVWKAIVDILAESYHTVTVDLRGHGESHAAPGPYRVETFADDLSALIAALDLDPLVAVGHSMGGAIVERFAIDRPDAVEGLVLLAPVPANAAKMSAKTDAFFRGTIGDPQAAAAWLSRLTVAPPPDEVAKMLRAAAAGVPETVAREAYESWTTLAFADEAGTIGTPTLVLAPEGERPDFVREHVADLIEGSTFRIVPASGHYLIVERPAEIAAAIDRFVGEL